MTPTGPDWLLRGQSGCIQARVAPYGSELDHQGQRGSSQGRSHQSQSGSIRVRLESSGQRGSRQSQSGSIRTRAAPAGSEWLCLSRADPSGSVGLNLPVRVRVAPARARVAPSKPEFPTIYILYIIGKPSYCSHCWQSETVILVAHLRYHPYHQLLNLI
jgi:hypothetical protein